MEENNYKIGILDKIQMWLDKKEKEYFLIYLRNILPNKSITKQQIFETKKEVYDFEGNKRWSKKMEIILSAILEEGLELPEALVKAKILTPEEAEYLKLAKTYEEGIDYLLKNKKDKGIMLKFLAFVYFIPFIVSLINIPAFYYWKHQNKVIGGMIESSLKIQNPRFHLDYPVFFQDIKYTLFIIYFYIFIGVFAFLFYQILYKYNFPLFNKIFKSKSYEMFYNFLNSFITNKEIGLNNLKTIEMLKKNTKDKNWIQIYDELEEYFKEGYGGSLKEILDKYNFDKESLILLDYGEKIKGKFYDFLLAAKETIKNKYELRKKFLDKVAYSFLILEIIIVFVVPLLIESWFLTITIPSSV